jgi:hypothetical protein
MTSASQTCINIDRLKLRYDISRAANLDLKQFVHLALVLLPHDDDDDGDDDVSVFC